MLNAKDAHENANKLAPKQVKKPEFIRHPYTKRRLRVIDAFEPNEFPSETLPDGQVVTIHPEGVLTDEILQQMGWIRCPACTSVKIDRLLVVENELPNGKPYQVVCCGSCTQQTWFVIMSKYAWLRRGASEPSTP